MMLRLQLAAIAALAVPSSGQDRKDAEATSKQPPAGAPWTKDFGEAHRLARETGRPIYVYSTKTY